MIKELLVDRGYINKEWIEKIKKEHHINTLIPLRKNMDLYQDAIALAETKKDWTLLEEEKMDHGELLSKTEILGMDNFELWTSSVCKQYTVVSKTTERDILTGEYKILYYVLASTKSYLHAREAILRLRHPLIFSNIMILKEFFCTDISM